MHKQTFNTVLLFTGSVLVGIIVLQSMWLMNVSRLMKKELNTFTNQALTETVARLEKKEQVHMIVTRMEELIPDSLDDRQNSLIDMMDVTVNGFDTIQTINVSSGQKEDKTMYEQRNSDIVKNTRRITFSRDLDSAMDIKIKNVDSLVEQMVIEIDNFSLDQRVNPDTIAAVLKDELYKKGIYGDFEYRILKDDSIIHSSAGFVVSSALMNFSTKLFPNDIFDKKLTLEMYYPASSSMGFIFKEMRNSLMLSGLFTLGVLIAFYITLRSINRQKKLSEMKSDFINNITHEFKTPIATSSIAVAALENKRVRYDDERFGYYTGVLKEENRKMNQQVEKVLQMSMMERKAFDIITEKTDIHQVLNESLRGFALIIKAEKVNLTTEFLATSHWTITDPFHIRNVFNNIIDNAIKYNRGEAMLQVTTETVEKQLVIRFIDKGIGMTAEVRKNAFEKFYRGQKGNIHEVKGFGLGLSYAKNIIELSGGTISIVSEPGKGTEVIIHLPLA